MQEKTKSRLRIRVAHMVHRWVMSDFDEIEDFNEFMKYAIEREQKQTHERLNKASKRLEEEEFENYWEIYAEDYQRIGSVFEKLALDSFIVILFSRVETGMASLCNAIRQDREKDSGEKIELRYTDLRGSGYLDQSRLYMEKVLRVDLGLETNAKWPEIMVLKTIRNAIVHDENWLRTKNPLIKKHIKRGLLELRNQHEDKGEISGRLIIKSAYIDFVLPLIRSFFEEIRI